MLAVALGLLLTLPKHDFSDQLPLPAGQKKKKAERISLECCDMCFLVATTPSKESDQLRRANSRARSEIHHGHKKDGKHDTPNPDKLCHFCSQELNGAIQETVGRNLDTFCNSCLHKQHSHDYLTASAKAPPKTGKTPLTAIHRENYA